MKKSKKIIITILMIALIIAAFVGGSAYARYISKITGEGKAEIASFAFKLNGNGDDTQKQVIPIYSTLDDARIKGHKIAPGTSGSFEIKIDATGCDVGIDYTSKVENEQNKPTNLKLYYNGIPLDGAKDIVKYVRGSIAANDNDKVRPYKITWDWPYQTGALEDERARQDIVDGNDGRKIQNYTFDLIITGTQQTPNN